MVEIQVNFPLSSTEDKPDRICIHCGEMCIDNNEPDWKTTCGDCFLSKILPNKSNVNLPMTFLESMTLTELGELPMTWGKKFNSVKLCDIPLPYWDFVSKNAYFNPNKHLHVYKYLKKRFLK